MELRFSHTGSEQFRRRARTAAEMFMPLNIISWHSETLSVVHLWDDTPMFAHI